jgi:hypothetical protein
LLSALTMICLPIGVWLWDTTFGRRTSRFERC